VVERAYASTTDNAVCAKSVVALAYVSTTDSAPSARSVVARAYVSTTDDATTARIVAALAYASITDDALGAKSAVPKLGRRQQKLRNQRKQAEAKKSRPNYQTQATKTKVECLNKVLYLHHLPISPMSTT
jgi:hypothetical protein